MGDDVVQLAGDPLPLVDDGLPRRLGLLLLELDARLSAERARTTGPRTIAPATHAIVMKAFTAAH